METLMSKFYLSKCELTPEISEYVVCSLFADVSQKLIKEIEFDSWYRIKFSTNLRKEFDCNEMTCKVAFERIPERAVVYRSPESQFLPPVKSFRQKLKNCVKYLRDKTGGSMETVSINGNEVNENNQTQ